jgi:hypothetical protein
MQAQQAILTFNEADRSLGGRLLKIAIEIDRVEGYSEPHAIAIAWTAEKIGARMGLHGVDLTALKFAALAHDLGERAMKRNYLLRPSALSWEETLDLWRHPILGEQAAGELKLPRQTQLLIRWHHEWWNGGGYPDGLAGRAIPPGARILRAVDSYFALISDRPHRRRFDRVEAEQIIADLAGIEFDPQVAKLMLQVLAEEGPGESTFAYPAPGGDEAVTRLVEDQPQPLDEVVYTSTYANQQAETPAESLSGNQNAAPGFASSYAPDEAPTEVMDEALTQRRLEMPGFEFASTEATDEVDDEIRTEVAAAGFASSDVIEEAGIEGWARTAGADLASSEASEEAMARGQMEMVHDEFTPPHAPNLFDVTEVESQTEMTAADFTSPDAAGEAGAEGQKENAGVETQITQKKQEEIES